MYLDDYTARIYNAEKHKRYIAEAEVDRAILRARAADPGTRTAALERLGGALIGLGRRLCEKRGNLHVEVAFRHVAAGAGGGRHVA